MMKENTKKVLTYLQEHDGEDLTAADVAEALDIPKKSVEGAFTSFCNKSKGWGYRQEAEAELSDGSHKAIKLLRLTEAGLAVDPDAE